MTHESLINLRLKKCVIESFLMILLDNHDRCETQEMSNKTIDDFYQH